MIKQSDSPFIFSFPHSGNVITKEMREKLHPKFHDYLPNTDWHLNELYRFLHTQNVSILSSSISRYVIDVNRDPQSLPFGNYNKAMIYEKSTQGETLYHTPPEKSERKERYRLFHAPYHDALEKLITRALEKHETIYLFDMHSFMGPITADVCLGNLRHNASTPRFLESVATAFEETRHSVAKNDVFTGGYILKRHGIDPRIEAIQIEYRYTNYLSLERCDTPKTPPLDTPLFHLASQKLKTVFHEISTHCT